MHYPILALPLLMILSSSPALAGSWTYTNSAGASGSAEAGCTRGDAQITCTGSRSFTNRFGNTHTASQNRTFTRNGVTGHRSVETARGETFDSNWSRLRRR